MMNGEIRSYWLRLYPPFLGSVDTNIVWRDLQGPTHPCTISTVPRGRTHLFLSHTFAKWPDKIQSPRCWLGWTDHSMCTTASTAHRCLASLRSGKGSGRAKRTTHVVERREIGEACLSHSRGKDRCLASLEGTEQPFGHPRGMLHGRIFGETGKGHEGRTLSGFEKPLLAHNTTPYHQSLLTNLCKCDFPKSSLLECS